MSSHQPPKPRQKPGPALPWVDKELDAMSEVTPSDMDAAARWWNKYAPAEAKGLLDSPKPERKP
jgi:hypothetical protein